MSNRVCPLCSIVYHMISDNTPDKRCKRCGRKVYWFPTQYSEEDCPEFVWHDHMWSSIIISPGFVDPNYVPSE